MKILLSFEASQDSDGGSANLADLAQAKECLKKHRVPAVVLNLVLETASSFSYKEYGSENGLQVSWGDKITFDWYDDLRQDNDRKELLVDGSVVWSEEDEDEDEESEDEDS